MPLPVNPKFSVGDRVYHGAANWTALDIQCPDCLGERTWSVTTPAGETFVAPCNTCTRGYFSTGTVQVYGDNPQVEELTIGSVRIDTADEDKPVSYMCHETGVGSGRVYYEESLFATRDEAQLFANCKAVEAAEARQQAEIEQRQRRKKDAVRKPRKVAAK